MDRTRRRLEPQDIDIEFAEEAVELLAEEGFDPEFGACPLRRTIQCRIDNELSRMMLEGTLNPDDKVVVGATEARLKFEVAAQAVTSGGAKAS